MTDERPGRPRLRAGDHVAVIAPSGPVDPDRLARGCALLTHLGLVVHLGKHVRDRHRFFAGTDAQRAADLRAAWRDPRIRAVLCARGGSGAARLLDLLDWAELRAAGPKLLHGSSDITALHAAFGAHLGVTTSFGPMVAAVLADPDPVSLAGVRAALLDPGPLVLGGPNAHTLVPGRALGRVVGGNLTVLTSLLGTAHAPAPPDGAILVFEDVNEAPYRVDRMLHQLRAAGWLSGLSGAVLGSWHGCGEPEQLSGVFDDLLVPLGIPVLAGLAIGHGRPQLTLPLGCVAELDTALGTLRFDG